MLGVKANSESNNEYDVYMLLINVPFLIEYMDMEMECFELE